MFIPTRMRTYTNVMYNISQTSVTDHDSGSVQLEIRCHLFHPIRIRKMRMMREDFLHRLNLDNVKMCPRSLRHHLIFTHPAGYNSKLATHDNKLPRQMEQ